MTAALIIVDVQHDFLPGGALAIEHGDEVIAPIVEMADSFDYVVKTRDAHPAQTSHFDTWPVHCVEGTDGAALHPAIAELDGPVFSKGTQPDEDAYSGFDGSDEHGRTLQAQLSHWGVSVVVIVGLALDHCVKATALDAQRAGFATTVLLSATRAVSPTTGEAAVYELVGAGVVVDR